MPSNNDPFQGDPIDPEEAEREEALTAEMMATEEMGDYFAFVDTARDAIEQGADKVTVPTAFLSRVINQIQPYDFDHLRELHNSICQKHGRPELKKG